MPMDILGRIFVARRFAWPDKLVGFLRYERKRQKRIARCTVSIHL